MEYRNLEIKVVSAKDLKSVNLISKMAVYVVVTISGDKRTKQKTAIDREGGTHPAWNPETPMHFIVDSSPNHQSRQSIVFTLRCDRGLGDKDIGEVHVPVNELIGTVGNEKWNYMTYQVRKPSGKAKGELNFCYKWGSKAEQQPAMAAKAQAPVTAYPAPMVGTSSAYYPASSAYPPPYGAAAASGGQNPYPPPQYPQAAYPPPPVAGYGYPPQPQPYAYPPPPQPGYGYPPQQQVQQQAPKKNFGGLGLGAGLLGGALGGLLIGDLISDGGGGGCGGGGCGGGGCGGGGF